MQRVMFGTKHMLAVSCALLAGCPSGGNDPSVGNQDITYELEEATATLNPDTSSTMRLQLVDLDVDAEGEATDDGSPFVGVVGLTLKSPLPDPELTGLSVPFAPFAPASISGEGVSNLSLRADGDAPLAVHQLVVEGTLTNVAGLPEGERKREFPVEVRVTAACVRETVPATAVLAEVQGRAGALTSDGSLYVWGENARGSILAVGADREEFTPTVRTWLAPQRVPVPAFDNLQSLTTGNFVVRLRENVFGQYRALHAIRGGRIQVAGAYYQSELESPTGEVGFVVGEIAGLTLPVTAVSMAFDHSLVIGADGSVWAWGGNFYGQLGIGNTDDSDTPVQVTTLSDVIAVAATRNAAGATSVALRRDGTVWTWGLGGPFSLLGDGATENRLVPAPVPGLTDVTGISVGAVSVMALRRDGSVWAWGNNDFGQLGNGDRTRSLVPIQAPGLTDAVAIHAAAQASFAVRRDGTLWAWGRNLSGQLGDGTDIDRLTPVQAVGLENVAAVSSSGGFTLALRRDGSVWAWGLNDNGQLGDGTTASRLVPRPVLGFGPASQNACDSPTPSQFTLSVTKLGPPATVVFSTPVGIECGFACSASFASGQSVRLRASIPAGSAFSGWSGCDRQPAGTAGFPDCEVDMNRDRAVEARVE